MGTTTSLRVAGTDIDGAKNGLGKNHGPLFQDSDRTRLRSEQLSYEDVDPNQRGRPPAGCLTKSALIIDAKRLRRLSAARPR